MGELRDDGVGREDVVDGHLRVGGWAADVVVVRERGDVGRVGEGEETGDDGGVPVGIAGGVGQAEAGGGDGGADGVGFVEPLVHVELGRPGFGVAEMGAEEVGLVA